MAVSYHPRIKNSSRPVLRLGYRIQPHQIVFINQSEQPRIVPRPLILNRESCLIVPGESKFIGREDGDEQMRYVRRTQVAAPRVAIAFPSFKSRTRSLEARRRQGHELTGRLS